MCLKMGDLRWSQTVYGVQKPHKISFQYGDIGKLMMNLTGMKYDEMEETPY